MVFGPPGAIYRAVLGVILFAAMIATLVFACGAGAKEKIVERTRRPMIDDDDEIEEDDRSSISLGWIVHTAMSAKVRVARAISAVFAMLVGRTESKPAASFERMEPNLGARRAPSLVPKDEDEEEYEEEEEEEEEEPAPRAR